jgi:dCMP deaminase
MDNQFKWDLRWMRIAHEVSTWSHDPSTKVGAVIVRPNKSLCSTGTNGFPQSMPDTPEYYLNRDEKYSRIIHAEMNAVAFAADPSLKGYTLYTYPFLTCDRCFVFMVQKGITRFVAPIANADQLTRWGSAFEKVRKYAKEVNVELVELEFTIDNKEE